MSDEETCAQCAENGSPKAWTDATALENIRTYHAEEKITDGLDALEFSAYVGVVLGLNEEHRRHTQEKKS